MLFATVFGKFDKTTMFQSWRTPESMPVCVYARWEYCLKTITRAQLDCTVTGG